MAVDGSIAVGGLCVRQLVPEPQLRSQEGGGTFKVVKVRRRGEGGSGARELSRIPLPDAQFHSVLMVHQGGQLRDFFLAVGGCLNLT